MKRQFSNNGKITLIRDEPGYLWKAGGCLYKEGSEELVEWVEKQKDLFMMDVLQKLLKRLIRNVDEITSPSRRIDLGRICSISNHKS